MLSKKIKLFLKENKLKAIDYAKVLGLNSPQSLNRKYTRKSFTIQEIIKLANMLDCDVSITDKNGNIITQFTTSDLDDKHE